MASSNLDDLLKSIRDEAKKESALVAMDGASDKDDQLVDEEIDERVLRLLGIEDVFDIDYATYKTLLKERMIAARMSGSEIPTEEAELLTDEFKRVKGSEGRFKIKKKKISAAVIRKTSPLKNISGALEAPQKLLAPAQELNPIEQVIKSLGNIVSLLEDRNSLLKKQSDKSRRESQNKKRAQKESKFEEKALGKVLEGAKKVIAPVQNILSKIFEIFTKIILAKFVMKFVDWFADPENEKKINAIGRFLSDHWPKLLAAYLLFGTSLGRFVVRIAALLIKGSIKLLTKVLPNLLKFIAANPKLALLAGAGGLLAAGAIVPAMFPETVKDDADKQADAAAKEKGNEQAAKDIRAQNENRNPLQKFGDFITGAGQEREEQAQRLETGEEKRYGFFGELAGGGQVSGPSGTDVVPARLTDGEFVMSKGAVDTFGTGFMESINAMGGGNNRPKKSNGTIYASGGGQIGDSVKHTVKTSDEPKSRPTMSRYDIEAVVEKVVDRKIGGQGGRSLGSTTQRDGGVEQVAMTGAGGELYNKIKEASQSRLDKLSYEGKGTILSGKGRGAKRSKGKRFDAEEKARRKEIADRGGFLGQLNRTFVGTLDVLSGKKSRYEEADKASTARVKQAGAAAIGRYYSSSDGKYYKDYNAAVKAREKRVAAAKTTQAIETSAPTATPKPAGSLKSIARLDYSYNPTAEKRHSELMKSTSPERIASYDAKHGAGAYSKKLQEKLSKIYTPEKAKQMPTGEIKPTGKVVGRENLPPATQKVLAKMDALRAGGKTPDMQYTRNGQKISKEQFNKVKSGDIIPGGGKPGGFFGGLFGGLFGGMGKPPGPAPGQKVVDGNIGKPTRQEQKDIDSLAAKKEKLRQSEERLAKMTGSKVPVPQPPTPPAPKVMSMNSSSSGGNNQSSSSASNSLPQLSASSSSTSKGRNTKLFGIF